MSAAAKTGLRWFIGLAIGALFVWLAALDWPLSALFGQGVRLDGTVLDAGWRFDLLYLIPYMGLLTAIHFLRVVRWAPLLSPLGEVDFKTLNRVSGVGFMYLFILPLRLGELARPYLLAQSTSISMTESLGTVVMERIIDGLIVALMLFIVLFWLPGAGGEGHAEIRLAAYLALAVFGGALVVLVGAWARLDWTLAVISRVGGLVSRGLTDKVVGLVEGFMKGMNALPHRRHFWSFVGWSMLYWALNGLGYYVLAAGFAGLNVTLLAAYAMMCCVVVGMMLPNPPANVGVFWYFLLKPLTLYGVTVGDPTAIAFGLMAWAGQLFQQGAFGLWFQARTPAALRGRRMGFQEASPDTPPARCRSANGF